jgi:hypothetical protein
MADFLLGLDGEPISPARMSEALAMLDDTNPSQTVTVVDIVPGTECRQGNANSVVLSLSLSNTDATATLFLKKVSPQAFGDKSWTDLRRTLAYARTEVRFYREFATRLRTKGVKIPRCALIDERLELLLGNSEVVAPPDETEPSVELLHAGGALLFLETVDSTNFFQLSPLNESQATTALRAAADMHAAAFEDRALLTSAATRLQRYGGSFALSIRNPKELTKLHSNWIRFIEMFASYDPALFARPTVCKLGERLHRWSSWVAKQLEASPSNPYATLIHGDYKAMNIFLPNDTVVGKDADALLIDFASSGVGYGPSDIAMHLAHSATSLVVSMTSI